MRHGGVRIVVGGAVVWGATCVSTHAKGVPLVPMPDRGACTEGMDAEDTWETLLEYLRVLCQIVGCVIDRSGPTIANGDVEYQGWAVVLSCAANGVRTDLSTSERYQGAAAASGLLGQLSEHPFVVSDELRPLLRSTAEAIGKEIGP